MQLDSIIAFALIAAIGLLALLRGGMPERFAALLIVWADMIDRVFYIVEGPSRFVDFDATRLGIDLLQFGAFLVLAMRANRLWTLWLPAAQLVALLGSLTMALADGRSQAYWAMTQLPLFVQLIALAVGIALHRHRQHRIGPYPDWRSDLLAVGGR